MMASEMGVLTFPQEKIVKKWRLEPGKMLLIDMEQGRIIDDAEVKQTLAQAKPYGEWVEKSRYFLGDLPKVDVELDLSASLLDLQQAFGSTQEDIKFILKPMIANGEEGPGSMGQAHGLPQLTRKRVVKGK